jgi:predicted O-methyltransferase YrrM
MTQELWTKVDDYLAALLVPPDPTLDATLEACAAAGLPSIQVSPCQGKFLMLLAQLKGARNILELGTLGGYSTIWLARALPPGGRLVTLEVDAKHAEVARANFVRARLDHLIELFVGPALDILPRLVAERRGPFDLIFIDADKPNTPAYFQWALKLSRRGTVIVTDNVIRKGAVADAGSTDLNVLGMRRFLELVAAEPRVSATTLQTVGSKGYDGFTIAIVNADP